MNRQRVAFVYAPALLPDTTRLETMPFALNTIARLADAGWEVDVFLWERPLIDYHTIFPANVRMRYEVTPKRMFQRSRPANLRLHPFWLTVRFMRPTNYRCVFGLGQIGSYLSALLSLASSCPLVLLNDEFPSLFGNSRWTSLERWAAQRADIIIVPSAGRIPHLAEELGLSGRSKPFVEFRNAPKVSRPLQNQDWHTLLGIPSDKRIFLNAGTLGDWCQVPEILSSTVYWPADAVLLLHSPTPEQMGGYRQQISHLHVPGRVFWTSNALSHELLNSLVGHCTGSFALYRDTGPNLSLTGTSSGKLMRSVMCATPVIASSFDSLRFVATEGIGVQVRHPAEIPAAVQELTKREQAYREQCLSFATREVMREERNWNAVVAALRHKIDLDKGASIRGTP
jgi:glycosyltransferase involved in cell wall biosynthesis